ncbi:hypothetical protein HDU76_000653 [Blyttiomyces sp. JEL0837]|nr:hypothetical protein HDU76_000653 [Blyttiomyces sp. JEL0837]
MLKATLFATLAIFAITANAAPIIITHARDANNRIVHSRNCLADVIDATGAELKHLERSVKRDGFTYEGETGPGNWGEIAKVCEVGNNQSPIDFEGTSLLLPPTKKPLVTKWPKTLPPLPPVTFINNGHTIQLNYQASGVKASTVQTNNLTYNLVQQHFHSPSEHHVDGKYYPLEAHFVHSTAAGNLSVIGIFFDLGEADPYIASFLKWVPRRANTKTTARAVNLAPIQQFIQTTQFFEYSGSLTTPPCSEGVLWLVAKTPLTISLEQYKALRAAMEFNSRFTQYNQDAELRAEKVSPAVTTANAQ